MAFWDRLRSKPKRKPRGKGLTGDERLKRAMARALDDTRLRNPARYEQLMQKLMERELGLGGDDGDPVKRMVESVKMLRSAGFIDDPRTAGQNRWLRDLLEPLGEGIGTVFMQMQQAKAMQAMAVNPPALSAPAATPAPVPAQTEEPPTEEPQPVQEGKLPLLSQIVIANLERRNPEEAADWLLSQPYAKTLTDALSQTADDDLLVLLDSIASRYPDLGGLVSWLRQRPDWLVATVRAVRNKAGVPQAAATGTNDSMGL